MAADQELSCLTVTSFDTGNSNCVLQPSHKPLFIMASMQGKGDQRRELIIRKSTVEETWSTESWKPWVAQGCIKQRAARHNQEILQDVLLQKGLGLSAMGAYEAGSISTNMSTRLSTSTRAAAKADPGSKLAKRPALLYSATQHPTRP